MKDRTVVGLVLKQISRFPYSILSPVPQVGVGGVAVIEAGGGCGGPVREVKMKLRRMCRSVYNFSVL